MKTFLLCSIVSNCLFTAFVAAFWGYCWLGRWVSLGGSDFKPSMPELRTALSVAEFGYQAYSLRLPHLCTTLMAAAWAYVFVTFVRDQRERSIEQRDIPPP